MSPESRLNSGGKAGLGGSIIPSRSLGQAERHCDTADARIIRHHLGDKPAEAILLAIAEQLERIADCLEHPLRKVKLGPPVTQGENNE